MKEGLVIFQIDLLGYRYDIKYSISISTVFRDNGVSSSAVFLLEEFLCS